MYMQDRVHISIELKHWNSLIHMIRHLTDFIHIHRGHIEHTLTTSSLSLPSFWPWIVSRFISTAYSIHKARPTHKNVSGLIYTSFNSLNSPSLNLRHVTEKPRQKKAFFFSFFIGLFFIVISYLTFSILMYYFMHYKKPKILY